MGTLTITPGQIVYVIRNAARNAVLSSVSPRSYGNLGSALVFATKAEAMASAIPGEIVSALGGATELLSK